MANKLLVIRQKMVFRFDPIQSKPHNMIALAAKRSGAGSYKSPFLPSGKDKN